MRGARILIVEDEPVTALDEQEVLTEAGYKIVGVVDTGEDAIKSAKDYNPDLILMDITLKGDMDGIQAAGVIKEHHNIPVIFVTAHENEKIFEDAKETVPFAYITKPISLGTLKFAIDVALYKNKMDARLRESEEQYRNLVETTPHGIYETDVSGHTIFANRAMIDMLGYSAEEMKGMNISDLLHENDRNRIVADIAQNIEKQPRPSPYICKFAASNGDIIDVEINWNYKRSALGKIIGLISIITNITEEKIVKDQLSQSDYAKDAVLDALDQISFGIVLVDENARVKFINQTAKEIAEMDDGISIRNNILSTTHFELRATLMGLIRKIIKNAKDNRILPREVMSLTRPSGKYPYSVMVSPLWGNHLRFGLGKLSNPLSVLFIADSERPKVVTAEFLQKLFGLTRSEAKLAERLVSDLTLEEAAQDMGITTNTARQYLKNIFSKTGAKRQSQLVKLILSTPI